MSRSQPLKNPAQYLKELIVKKGESERLWTSFKGANIVWNPHEHAHSDTAQDAKESLFDFWEEDQEKYGAFLFHLTHNTGEDTVYHFSCDNLHYGSAYLGPASSPGGVDITFSLPYMNAAEFEDEVEILSHIAILWAKMAQKEVTSVRVFIHCAYLRWEDMEGENLLYTEYESN